MPILYENVFQKSKQTYAHVTDSQKTLTVSLAAGKGILTEAHAFDKDGTTISKAYPGQYIGLFVTIQNQGDQDEIWISVKDKDTGTLLQMTQLVGGMPAGQTLPFTLVTFSSGKSVLQMPNKIWNLLIEAGHGAP